MGRPVRRSIFIESWCCGTPHQQKKKGEKDYQSFHRHCPFKRLANASFILAFAASAAAEGENVSTIASAAGWNAFSIFARGIEASTQTPPSTSTQRSSVVTPINVAIATCLL